MRTPLRAVRISDELWYRALALAEANGDNLSQIMRDALDEYVENNEPGRPTNDKEAH